MPNPRRPLSRYEFASAKRRDEAAEPAGPLHYWAQFVFLIVWGAGAWAWAVGVTLVGKFSFRSRSWIDGKLSYTPVTPRSSPFYFWSAVVATAAVGTVVLVWAVTSFSKSRRRWLVRARTP